MGKANSSSLKNISTRLNEIPALSYIFFYNMFRLVYFLMAPLDRRNCHFKKALLLRTPAPINYLGGARNKTVIAGTK